MSFGTEDLLKQVKLRDIITLMHLNAENIERLAEEEIDLESKKQKLRTAKLYRSIDQGKEGAANYCERFANITGHLSEFEGTKNSDKETYSLASMKWQALADKFHDSKVEIPR